ncbi:MAG TPA: peptide-N4-asparagine amidase [Pseudonocardiaceae bacterium]|nr:peptide-N4-asparagine amidase [Pseudonocardiaceae bacterium]
MYRTRALTGLLTAALLSLTGSAVLAAPATATTPSVEINSQNPVTAEPPVSRPPTHSCTETLANSFPSNDATGAAQNFTGTLTPPADCTGPWTKVVLDWTTSVQGRQYDRSGYLDLGTTQVYFGTTYEPDPAGITYHFAKDITEYSALLHAAQPFNGGIGNYTNSTDTGVYTQTVTITYYQADRTHPAPTEPNTIVGLGSPNLDPSTPTAHLTATGLPHNITRAYLEVYIKGNGCDEQWFTDVPNDVAAKYPAADMCGNGPYREVDAAIDGHPAGLTQYFPYIYTGGIVPTLWRPIPAVGTFDMSPELLDITPFVGQLVTGTSHDIALSVPDLGDVWNLSANLLLYTDPHTATTSGALTSDTLNPTPTTNTTETPGTDNSVTATVTTSRDWTISGYVTTSAGRITTTVSQHAGYRNTDTVSNGGFSQTINQTDQGWTRSTSTGGFTLPTSHLHTWSYPIKITENAQVTDDNNFNLSGSVDMTRTLSDTTIDGIGLPTITASTDEVSANGLDQRANGQTIQADGNGWQRFIGDDDTGHCYSHYLAADHGYITTDHLSRC